LGSSITGGAPLQDDQDEDVAGEQRRPDLDATAAGTPVLTQSRQIDLISGQAQAVGRQRLALGLEPGRTPEVFHQEPPLRRLRVDESRAKVGAFHSLGIFWKTS
jgi:hypothetical protein